MKKNWIVKLLCSVLVGTMILGTVGCANTGSKETSAEETGGSETTGDASTETSTEDEFVLSYPLDTDVTFSYFTTYGLTYSSDLAGFDESPWHQGLEKATGVKVEWMHQPGEVYTNLDLLLADKKDRPDVFSRGGVTSSIQNNWVLDDVIVELTEYLPPYAPDFWEYIHREENKNTLQAITDDAGRFWFIPGIKEDLAQSTYLGPMIRQDWLDECGLDMPVTMDELEKVLVAFKDKYDAKFVTAYNDFRGYGFLSGTDAMGGLIGSF